jgi:homoserine dehydrogenase
MSLLDLDPHRFDPRPQGQPAVGGTVAGAPVVVLKFGSSILHGPHDVPEVVSEIYRHVRRGEKVVAVVSALNGHTDQLLEQARTLGGAHDNRHLPRYVALGEEKAASLVAIGCDRVGLDCAALGVRELGIVADGSPEEAVPVSLASPALLDALARHEVVVVPGFGALDEDGAVVLLGRGGTDLTAVFLAAELGLGAVRLLKDVDGVYDSDPAIEGAVASRYAALDWKTARTVAGKLVQHRAVEVAEARGIVIEVAALGREAASRIGPDNAPPVPAQHPRPRRVALAGCGVVGGGVLQRLLARPDVYEVVSVLVRDPAKVRDVAIPAELLTDNPAHLFANNPDVLVEALSEGPPAERLIRWALEGGIDVVSANKQAVAIDLPGLTAAAEKSGAALAYSAAVGGGSPMLETVRTARAAGEIASLEAVLNGTVNFMLDRLAKGEAFDAALAAARQAGFAEEDPSSDLEGHDAAAKLRILAYEAFGVVLADADIPRDALNAEVAAQHSGCAAFRQIGRCRADKGGAVASVGLESALEDKLFRTLRGERNALRVTLKDGHTFVCRGRGAGRWPTSESVLADLGELVRATD